MAVAEAASFVGQQPDFFLFDRRRGTPEAPYARSRASVEAHDGVRGEQVVEELTPESAW